MAAYGLIGERLSHSFSPEVHRQFADYDYRLIELPPEAVAPFLAARAFAGLNVTIPYKRTVMPLCDALSPEAAPSSLRQSDSGIVIFISCIFTAFIPKNYL